MSTKEAQEKGSGVSNASYATIFAIGVATAVALVAISIYGVYVNNKNAQRHCKDRLSDSQTLTARNISIGGLAVGILLGAIMILLFVGYHTKVITIGDIARSQEVSQALSRTGAEGIRGIGESVGGF